MLREKLSAEQYRVTQENGTETPFKNEYWDNTEEGIYVDIVSGALLFTSRDKFDSSCGWPSFSKPADGAALVEKTDSTFGMKRTEVRSPDSDSHLGHVFDDGPGSTDLRPNGLRYCINSASLRFIPAAESTAIFAAGCFWGSEAYFRKLSGVLAVTVGYCGGTTENPTYEAVCSGSTGHAEAIRIIFDPERISCRDLMRHFFRMHDPTTRNRQGNDVGSQYRSAIFYASEAQRAEAVELIREINESGTYAKPVVTELSVAPPFYSAEEYHQEYLRKNPGGYCHVNLNARGFF